MFPWLSDWLTCLVDVKYSYQIIFVGKFKSTTFKLKSRINEFLSLNTRDAFKVGPIFCLDQLLDQHYRLVALSVTTHPLLELSQSHHIFSPHSPQTRPGSRVQDKEIVCMSPGIMVSPARISETPSVNIQIIPLHNTDITILSSIWSNDITGCPNNAVMKRIVKNWNFEIYCLILDFDNQKLFWPS